MNQYDACDTHFDVYVRYGVFDRHNKNYNMLFSMLWKCTPTRASHISLNQFE